MLAKVPGLDNKITNDIATSIRNCVAWNSRSEWPKEATPALTTPQEAQSHIIDEANGARRNILGRDYVDSCFPDDSKLAGEVVPSVAVCPVDIKWMKKWTRMSAMWSQSEHCSILVAIE